MLFDRNIVEAVERLPKRSWQGTVFRHMFASFPPERENVRGARWNPPGTPAIYTSLTRDAAIAEADYYISLQPIRPSAARTVYRIDVNLNSVINLSDQGEVSRLGLDLSNSTLSHELCQPIGGAIEWLGNDGVLVRSVRSDGINLVIFPNRVSRDYRFEVIDSEEVF